MGVQIAAWDTEVTSGFADMKYTREAHNTAAAERQEGGEEGC